MTPRAFRLREEVREQQQTIKIRVLKVARSSYCARREGAPPAVPGSVDGHVIPQTGSVVPARSCDSGEREGVGPPGIEVSGPSRAVKDACGVATAMSCAHP
ncbi:hypothetical protein ACFV8Z_15350 [Streptomyces sp. NPDC059837]|uniref:hypothetical protein n=1 Tax=Streptomyces sp. NPDC059837 TaxID=3346968 RepID=UPI00365A323A